MSKNTSGIKYECCYCKKLFHAEAAIDGYEKGYKKGFLCPNCGQNIIAGVLAKQKLMPGDSIWIVIAGILFLPVYFTENSEVLLLLFGKEIELNTVLFVLWLIFLSALLIFRPSLFRNKTFLTSPVKKD